MLGVLHLSLEVSKTSKKSYQVTDSHETWKDIAFQGKSYAGYYQVSDLGNVRSVDRFIQYKDGKRVFKEGQSIVGSYDKDGYHQVLLYIKTVRKTARVHRLVLETFVPNIEMKPEINHLNGIKGDNRIENLEWATSSENRLHAVKTGLQPTQYGKNNPNNKLSEGDVLKIRKLRKEGKALKKIAEIIGTSESNVKNVIYGYTWTWLKDGENRGL